MKRRSPGYRLAAALGLAVILLAQPQVLCGLHCLFTHPGAPTSDPMAMQAMASGHEHGGAAHAAAGALADDGPGHGGTTSAPMVLCHGGRITSHPAPLAPRLALAWLPGLALASVAQGTVAVGFPADVTPPRSAELLLESPPPRA